MSLVNGYRDDYLHADVPPHVVNSGPSCHDVHVSIFQPAEVVLVCSVQQVVDRDVQLCHFALLQLYVGPCRQVLQRVAGRGCLGVVGTIDVILAEVALDVCRDEDVV